VHDPLLVRGFEGRHDLSCDREGFVQGDRAVNDDVAERLPLDQLHHQGTRAAPAVRRFFEPVDGGDVRMAERRQHFRLALEAGQPFGIVCERLGQHLDGDMAIELGVACAVDLAHSACTDGSLNLVRADAGAGRETHRRQILDRRRSPRRV
jgi:hypothetical protein